MFTVPPKYHKTSVIYIILLNIVVLGATFTLFFTTRNSEKLAVQDAFQEDSTRFVNQLESELHSKGAILADLNSLVAQSEQLSSEGFSSFVDKQEANEFADWSIGWIPNIIDSGTATNLSLKRWDLDLSGWVVSDAPPQAPILFIKSENPNSDFIGHDFRTQPQIDDALSKAKNLKASVAIPNPAPLTNDSTTAEILLLNPVWQAAEPNSANTEADQQEFLGFAVGFIRINQLLIDGIQNQNFRDISIEINDTTSLINQDTLFSNSFNDQSNSEPPIPPYSDRFQFGNSEWQIRVIPNENYLEIREGILPWGILISGILVTIIVNALTWFMVFETYAIREQVIERTEALNSTNELLWASTNELNKTKNLLKTKIQENERIGEDLEKTKIELAQTENNINHEFLETMTKEIRTPTNGMLGMADMLNKTPLDSEQISFVQTIKSSGHTLLTTINDIMDFTKLESGELPIVLAPFELRRTLEEALEWVAYNAHEKGLELILDIDDSLPEWIESDERRINQIISALLNHSLSNTNSGEILISARGVKQNHQYSVAFSVKDTGETISAEELEEIFNTAEDDSGSIKNCFLASGFSLGISKKLAELMGGDLSVSTNQAGGNVYNLSILASSAAPVTCNADQLEINILRDKSCLIIYQNDKCREVLEGLLNEWQVANNGTSTIATALKMLELSPGNYDFILFDTDLTPETPQAFIDALKETGVSIPPIFALTTLNRYQGHRKEEIREIVAWLYKPLKKKPLYNSLSDYFLQLDFGPENHLEELQNYSPEFAKSYPLQILLAEDNPINQKVAVSTLNKLGYCVDFVSNGIEAMDKVVHKRYDLVLMDIHMPRMSGIHAIKGIKRSVNRNLQIKPLVIAMTNAIRQDEKDECIKAGANGFILKPFQVEHLVKMIQDVYTYKMNQKAKLKQPENSLVKPTAKLHQKVIQA